MRKDVFWCVFCGVRVSVFFFFFPLVCEKSLTPTLPIQIELRTRGHHFITQRTAFFLIPLAGLGISRKSAQKSTISILAPFIINSSSHSPNIYRLSLRYANPTFFSSVTPNLDLHSNPNSFLEFGIWLFLCRGDLRPADDGWLLGTLWLSI